MNPYIATKNSIFITGLSTLDSLFMCFLIILDNNTGSTARRITVFINSKISIVALKKIQIRLGVIISEKR